MAGSYLARWRLFRVQSTQIRIRAPRLSALRGEPSRPPHPGAQGTNARPTQRVTTTRRCSPPFLDPNRGVDPHQFRQKASLPSREVGVLRVACARAARRRRSTLPQPHPLSTLFAVSRGALPCTYNGRSPKRTAALRELYMTRARRLRSGCPARCGGAGVRRLRGVRAVQRAAARCAPSAECAWPCLFKSVVHGGHKRQHPLD